MLNVDLRRLVQSGAIYSIPIVLMQAIGFLLLPVYTAYLSREDYGIVTSAVAGAALVTAVVSSGPRIALERLYFRDENDPEALCILVTTSLGFVMLLGLLAIALGVLFVSWGTALMFGSGSAGARPLGAYMLLALLVVPCTSLLEHSLVLLQNTQQAKRYALIRVASLATTILITLILVVGARAGALGVLIAGLVAPACASLIGLASIRHYLVWSVRWSVLLRILKFSLPLLPVILSGWVVSWVDRFFLDHLVGLGVTGVYAVAVAIGSVTQVVIAAMMQAWTPVYYRELEARGNLAHPFIARTITLLFSLFVGTGLCIAVFAPEIVSIMTKQAYHGASSSVPFIVLYFLLGSINGFFTNNIYFSGRSYLLLLTAPLPIFLIVPLNLLLIPQFGGVGAAISLAGTAAAYTLADFLISQRVYPMRLEYNSLAKISCLGFVSFLVGWQISLGSLMLDLALKSISLLFFPVLLVFANVLPFSTVRMAMSWASVKLRRAK